MAKSAKPSTKSSSPKSADAKRPKSKKGRGAAKAAGQLSALTFAEVTAAGALDVGVPVPTVAQTLVELSDTLDEVSARAEHELEQFKTSLAAALAQALDTLDRELHHTAARRVELDGTFSELDAFVQGHTDVITATTASIEALVQTAEAANREFRNGLAVALTSLADERASFEARALEATAELGATCRAAGERSRQESREATDRVTADFTEEVAATRAEIRLQQEALQALVDATLVVNERLASAQTRIDFVDDATAADSHDLEVIEGDRIPQNGHFRAEFDPDPDGRNDGWRVDVREALAAELAADPDPRGLPRGDDDLVDPLGSPDSFAGEVQFDGAVPVGVDGPFVPAPSEFDVVAGEPLETAAPVTSTRTRLNVETLHTAKRAVSVTVPSAALSVSVETLARSAADGMVRLDVVHTAANGTTLAVLRLTVWDVSGWWEYHDLVVTAANLEPASVVVGLADVRDALATWDQFSECPEVVINFDNDLTIGNSLVLTKSGLEPELSWNRALIERVELPRGLAGVEIETQLGRLAVPSRLVSVLRSRQAQTVELMVIDDGPSLAARVPGPVVGTVVTIVTPLVAPDIDLPPDQSERRDLRTRDVKHLVRALSFDATAEELDEILEHGVAFTRRLAAAHPNLARERVEHLLTNGTEAMRGAAAGNPRLDLGLCEVAAKDSSAVVRSALAANPTASAECLSRLAADEDAQVRARAASNIAIDPSLLELLAVDPDANVRAAVASCCAVRVEVLELLARDPDTIVCAAVARNERCPEMTLRELVSVVPHAVMASPRAPASLLEAGSRVNDPALRALVAANPATPPRRLDALSHDESLDVLRNLADNPSTPAAARRRLRRTLGSE